MHMAARAQGHTGPSGYFPRYSLGGFSSSVRGGGLHASPSAVWDEPAQLQPAVNSSNAGGRGRSLLGKGLNASPFAGGSPTPSRPPSSRSSLTSLAPPQHHHMTGSASSLPTTILAVNGSPFAADVQPRAISDGDGPMMAPLEGGREEREEEVHEEEVQSSRRARKSLEGRREAAAAQAEAVVGTWAQR